MVVINESKPLPLKKMSHQVDGQKVIVNEMSSIFAMFEKRHGPPFLNLLVRMFGHIQIDFRHNVFINRKRKMLIGAK